MKDLIQLNIIMIVSGLVAYLYMSSNRYMDKNNYSEKYKIAKKAYNLKSGLTQLALLIVGEVVVVMILIRIGIELNDITIYKYVVPGAMVFLIPGTVVLSRKFNSQYKELAQETGEEVVVDFDFSMLKEVFDIRVELPLSICALILSYFGFINHGFSTIAYSIGIVWMLFLVIKFSKNMNRASYIESYRVIVFFNVLYSYLLLAIAGVFTLVNYLEGIGNYKFGVVVFVIFLYRSVVATFKSPKILKKIKEV